MVIQQKVEELFSDLLTEDKIKYFPNHCYAEIILSIKFGLKIKIYFEYLDELYNIKIFYPNVNEYCITSYDFYKKFVKQNLKKKLFKKSNIFQHIKIIKKYLDENIEFIKDESKLLQLISEYEEKYQNIFL